MIRYVLSLLLLSVVSFANAQFKNYNNEQDLWFPGHIFLDSEEVLSGDINYNFVTDQLRFKLGEDIQTLPADRVISFQFTTDQVTEINYITAPYDLYGSGYKRDTFFQMLYKNEDYAVLSKHQLEIIDGSRSKNIAGETFDPIPWKTVKERTSEHIYLAGNHGTIIHFSEKKKSNITSLMHVSNYELVKYRYNEQKPTGSKVKDGIHHIEIEKYKLDKKANLRKLFGKYMSSFEKFVDLKELDLRYLQDLCTALNFRS